MTLYLRFLCFVLMAAAFLCGCQYSVPPDERPTQASSAQPNDHGPGERLASGGEAAEPRRVPECGVECLAERFAAGSVRGYSQQSEILAPNLDAALYLMRASRYREAADVASRVEQTPPARFILAKARILSGDSAPQSPVLKDLMDSTKKPEFREIYETWYIWALLAEGQFDDAWAKWRTAKLNEQASRALLLALAEKRVEAGDIPEDARTAMFNALGKLKGNAFEAAAALYWQYRLAMLRQKPDQANHLKRQIVLRYPATQLALWPELIDGLRLTPQERLSRARQLVSHFDYENARRELMPLAEDKAAPEKVRDEAEWLLAGVSMTNSDMPALSETIYRRWAEKKGNPRQEEATFSIVRALSRQLRYEDALKAIDRYLALYPKGQFAMRSLYLQGWYWFELRENEKARPYLLQYAEKTNDTAVWGFYAQTYIREGRWREAIKAFENLKRNSNPIVHGKALYWQAYAWHQLGDAARAKALFAQIHDKYPLTYYDVLALARLRDWYGVPYEETLIQWLRWETDLPLHVGQTAGFVLLPWGTGEDLSYLAKDIPAWKDIEVFIAHDAVAQARQIYQKNETAILQRIPADKRQAFRRYATHLVESYFAAWEDASGSVRGLSSTYPTRSDPRHLMGYPQAFAPLVEHLAREYRIPTFFVYGIMLQESRFRSWQVSSADAIGALQMIPKTARVIAKALGLRYHPETFFDPKIGFPYSLYYMRLHAQKWHGNLTFVAGSYNGGPHRIGPWVLRDKDKTMDFIVEEFSFDESRHYARKVAEHTLRYAYLYAQTPTEWLALVEALFPAILNTNIADNNGDWGI